MLPPPPAPPASVYPHKLRRLYWPFLGLAEECRDVVGRVAGSFRTGGRRYTIPKFTFLGPAEDSPQTRLGVFALFDGAEVNGSKAVLRFLELLASCPALAKGYDVTCYPVCNPTGYEDDTAHNRSGVRLEQSLWRGAEEPEIKILEDELETQRFDGIITLRSEPDAELLEGRTWSQVVKEHVLEPALASTRAGGSRSLQARGYPLSPPTHHPRPFELSFSLPGRAPQEQQVESAVSALVSVLAGYRGFISLGGDL